MKTTIKALLVVSLFSLIFFSCKKEDEGNELHIEFKTGAGYTSSDATLPGGSDVKIGINASTDKAKDPIIAIDVTESVNGGTGVTVGGEDNLSVTEYEQDYNFTIDTISGTTYKYTFTITNRDGLIKQNSLTITVQ